MTIEIHITETKNLQTALLIVDNSNIASITGDIITVATNWKSHANTDVFAYTNGEITGQYNNLTKNFTITDNR